MRFSVPQFIEHEARIVGPLTFKQFAFVGTAGTIGLILYASAPFPVFLVVTIVVGGIAAAMAFLKIGGIPFPSLIGNFLKFGSEPKIYVWERKEQTGIKIYEKKARKNKQEEGELPLKIAEKSRLKKLQTKMETETK